MKKILALLLAVCLMLTLIACKKDKADDNEETTTKATETITDPSEETDPSGEETEPTKEQVDANFGLEDEMPIMTYAEYMAAEKDAPVIIKATIQAAQEYSAEYGNTSLYLQSEEGAYFVYRLPCTAEEYAQLVPGTVVCITGYKGIWDGEIEICDANFTIVEGEGYTAEALDVTELLGTDALIENMNKKVSFTGMTVAASKDAEGNDVAFLYNWDGSGTKGSDLYFNVSYNGAIYNVCVETALCNGESEVYAAAEALKIGDVIDMEGFLFWYGDAMNPHITSITVK